MDNSPSFLPFQFFGHTRWRERPLLQAIQGDLMFRVLFLLPFLFPAAPAFAEPVAPSAISVVDGDTIDVGPYRYRLVGFDTPEIRTPSRRVDAEEHALGIKASARLREIVAAGGLDLKEVRCSCTDAKIAAGTCNHGRKCGLLTANGENVGATLIREGLAKEFVCGPTKCPRMPKWP
jgi:endonuclease YncB( thermonuclease family)